VHAADGPGFAPTLHEVMAGFPRPPAAPSTPSALFPPGSVTRHLTAERVLVLGGGRALLMQIAHPVVAAGVADHRDPDRLPWERLWDTLDAVLTVVFGDERQVSAVGDRIAPIHRGVVGERGGRPYRALDHELLTWVHATLVDSAIVTCERLIGPMPPRTRARYYEEMKAFAGVFGVPRDALPADLEAFDRYLAATVPSLDVTPEARRLACDVLDPPVPAVLRPAVALHRLVTLGLLPPELRRGFGLAWSAGHERSFAVLAGLLRGAVPLLPVGLRRWPHAANALRSEPTRRP
jgi:uncharacterized protein (DUF2236 family)